MAGALDGITIVDFSRVLAGPYATMLLADFGATVIKVERPGSGDETRAWNPPVDAEGMATYFAAVNRNKRSVVRDLSDEDERQSILELVRTADVVVENFRDGAMDRLGLGYDRLSELNPRLIYCSITGFGTAAGAAGAAAAAASTAGATASWAKAAVAARPARAAAERRILPKRI